VRSRSRKRIVRYVIFGLIGLIIIAAIIILGHALTDTQV
jgi:putative flippase GtrA